MRSAASPVLKIHLIYVIYICLLTGDIIPLTKQRFLHFSYFPMTVLFVLHTLKLTGTFHSLLSSSQKTEIKRVSRRICWLWFKVPWLYFLFLLFAFFLAVFFFFCKHHWNRIQPCYSWYLIYFQIVLNFTQKMAS